MREGGTEGRREGDSGRIEGVREGVMKGGMKGGRVGGREGRAAFFLILWQLIRISIFVTFIVSSVHL